MSDPTPPAALPPTIAGRYRPLRELGRGGFGVVYLVEHANTGDRLALKVLYGRAAADAMSLERFQREARASARIKSEHVVKVTDADAAPELGGAPFLVMELLEGKDVEQLAEQRGALLPEEVVGILSQAAKALDKAHALGIVHRDLKPENMFLHQREDGTSILKILDFGISKSIGESSGDIRAAGMTSTGAVLGTPLYMAPEQARGISSSIGPATDVWAIGLMAFRLLTGHVYWRANTVADLLVQIIASELTPPTSLSPALPPAFDAWFARSVCREPGGRFRTVGEQIDALATALGVVAGHLPSNEVLPLSALRPRTVGPAASAPAASGSARSTGAALSLTRPNVQRRGRTVAWSIAGVAFVAVAAITGTLAVQARSSATVTPSAAAPASVLGDAPRSSSSSVIGAAAPAPTACASAVLTAAPPSAPPRGVSKPKGGPPAPSADPPATPPRPPARPAVFNPEAP